MRQLAIWRRYNFSRKWSDSGNRRSPLFHTIPLISAASYPNPMDLRYRITGDKEGNVELADELNEDLGVTPIQRQAMEIGSMAGWDVPGADPKHYEESYSGQTSCANFEQKQ